MAPSLVRELRFTLYVVRLPASASLQLLVLLLLLLTVAIAPNRKSDESHCCLQHTVDAAATSDVDVAAAASTAFEQGSDVHDAIGANTIGADHGNSLIFQTSFDLRVPCVGLRVIRPPRSHEPPARLVIATPTQRGTYPVILFKHGFSLANCFYIQLFQFLASSGYIVVAPQTVTLSMDCTEEIEATAEVANWIPTSLPAVLDAAVSLHGVVVPDAAKLVMAGHSRGGKTAFAIALGMASVDIPSFSALVALDPVDCTKCELNVHPPVVKMGCNHTHNQLPFPTIILGTGYSSKSVLPGMPACAPACCDHTVYFDCSSAPVMYHLVASEYGHLDFLNDAEIWTAAVCVPGSSKMPLRNYAGELMVAFLESALKGRQESMNSMMENWQTAPIKLEKPQIFRQDSFYKERVVPTLFQPSPESAVDDA